jgi:branched-chain amino acid transport system substrate-binding protein
MQEFGLLNNLTVVGASCTVTAQNIGAIGKAAEGFVTGVGYSAEIDTPGLGKQPDLTRGDRFADRNGS